MRVSTLLLFCFSSCAVGISVKAGEGINYLDCPEPPADRPVLFAPGTVSTKPAWEEKIAFTADGKEMFFGRHPDGGDNYFKPKVMHARYEDGKWSAPEVASFSEGRQMGWPLICERGKRLFLEEYEGKVLFVRKESHVWSAPERLLPEVKAERGFGLGQTTNDETLYFHDRYDRIAYSAMLVDGKRQAPKPLSYRINPCVEFFVSPENDYIIFQPLHWKNPLHISYRNADGEWDMPIPFGLHFKGNGWDLRGIGPSVSPDGKYFFIGMRGDIYWMKSDFIEAMRKYKRHH